MKQNTDIAKMHEDIVLIKADIAVIKEALKGNGQKGLLQRVDELENWKFLLTGGLVILSLLIAWGFINLEAIAK